MPSVDDKEPNTLLRIPASKRESPSCTRVLQFVFHKRPTLQSQYICIQLPQIIRHTHIHTTISSFSLLAARTKDDVALSSNGGRRVCFSSDIPGANGCCAIKASVRKSFHLICSVPRNASTRRLPRVSRHTFTCTVWFVCAYLCACVYAIKLSVTKSFH